MVNECLCLVLPFGRAGFIILFTARLSLSWGADFTGDPVVSVRTRQREHESGASLVVDLASLYHMGSLVCEWLDIATQVLFSPSSCLLLPSQFGCKSTTCLRPSNRKNYSPAAARSLRAAALRCESRGVAQPLPLCFEGPAMFRPGPASYPRSLVFVVVEVNVSAEPKGPHQPVKICLEKGIL